MNDPDLSSHLQALLRGVGAHVDVAATLRSFPPEFAGLRVARVTHTPWRLLEHMRLAQWDILEYCRDPGHRSPPFPQGYWPEGDAPPDGSAWRRSVQTFLGDLNALSALVAGPACDLLAPIPPRNDHTLLREILLVADHNAYHLGQLVLIRKALAGSRQEP